MIPENIFQSEITILEAEQTAIFLKIKALKRAENLTKQTLQTLKSTIAVIKTLEKTDTLKALILDLFENNPTMIPISEIIAEDIDKTDHSTISSPTVEQIIEIAEAQSNDYCQLIPVSEQICYYRNSEGQIIATYAGFKTKFTAVSWQNYFTSLKVASELRLSKRLTTYKWELKIKGLQYAQIKHLKNFNLSEICDSTKSQIWKPQS